MFECCRRSGRWDHSQRTARILPESWSETWFGRPRFRAPCSQQWTQLPWDMQASGIHEALRSCNAAGALLRGRLCSGFLSLWQCISPSYRGLLKSGQPWYVWPTDEVVLYRTFQWHKIFIYFTTCSLFLASIYLEVKSQMNWQLHVPLMKSCMCNQYNSVHQRHNISILLSCQVLWCVCGTS